VRVSPYPLRAAEEHTRLWREAQLHDIATGVRTTALGIRPCHCKRRWSCHLCDQTFICWNVWPFLWDMMPGELRNKKLCRRCYGSTLVEAIDAADRARIEGGPEGPALPSTARRGPAWLPPSTGATPGPPGPRYRHYRRR
jgi:hypothetical protein